MTDTRTTDTPAVPRKLSPLAANLVLAGAALVVTLLLCELLLRLVGVSYTVFVWTDPVRGIAHIPGARGRVKEGNNRHWVEINHDGLLGPDVAQEHPPGTYRIAFLGDSYIEAFQVPFQGTVGEVLESRLSELRGTPVEVLNFGVGGYGTGQELLTLQHEVWKYSPDLILLGVTTGNDISDNYRPLKRVDYVPYYVFRDGQLMLDTTFLQSKGYQRRVTGTRVLLGAIQRSRLLQLANRVRQLRRIEERQKYAAGGSVGNEMGLHHEIYLPPATPDWQAAWRVTEDLLRMIRDECRRKQTPFALVTLSAGIQVSPERTKKDELLHRLGVEDLYYPERRLKEFAQREGIPVLNLAPTMAQQAEERQVFFHADHNRLGVGHWNQEGNRAAGELIASWLAGEFAARPKAATRP